MTTLSRLVVRNLANTHGGPLGGTKYDMTNACPRCGTGAEQTGPLLLRSFRPSRKRIFSTLDDEFLVDEMLAAAFTLAGFGSRLVDVLDARTMAPLPVRQLRAQNELPPFLSSTQGVVRERPCSQCDRDGYFGIPHRPIELHYKGLSPQVLASDLLVTYERFGNSRLREPFRDSVFAAPLYVATDRFAAVLEAEKVSEVELQPAVIES